MDQLDRIDWNFPSAGTGIRSAHSGYSFPGNFIPQIPARLISALSQKNDLVLDPFSGSGTTAVESLAQGRRIICSDVLHVSVLMTKGKINSFVASITQETKHFLFQELTWPHLCETDETGENGEGSNAELRNWYSSRTLSQLRFLWKLIERVHGEERDSLESLFVGVLFTCAAPGLVQVEDRSVRRHHWGWIADNVRPKALVDHNAIDHFLKRLESLRVHPKVDLPAHLVIQQDARSLAIKENSVDLVVTSPPYIGVIDYTRAHRLLYLWREWDFDADRSIEIGARYKRHRKNAQAEYLDDMALCLNEIQRVLKRDKFFAMVIGESKKFQGTADLLIEKTGATMKRVWGPANRTGSRRRVSDRNASDSFEQIVVFQKK